MLVISAALVLTSCAFQEPADHLLQDLAKDDAAVRLSAADELAASTDLELDRWLVKNTLKGSPQRQRALLLSCALRGTSDCWSLVEKQSKLSGGPKAERAWALLLAATYGEAFGKNPEPLFKRAKSQFEVDCVLAGLMANPSFNMDLRTTKFLSRRRVQKHRGALEALAAISQHPAEWGFVAEPAELAIKLVCSHLPGQPLITTNEIVIAEKWLQSYWAIGARRKSPVSLDILKASPVAVQNGSYAMCLLDSPANQSPEIFKFLQKRLPPTICQNWLWGIAGKKALSIDLSSVNSLKDYHYAALIERFRVNPQQARSLAQQFLPKVRELLATDHHVADVWPAYICLALSEDAADWKLIKEKLERSSAEDAAILHPIWQLAGSRFSETAAKHQFTLWARELMTGQIAYMDFVSSEWLRYYLLSGTDALLPYAPKDHLLKIFSRKPDHALGHLLYVDIGELISSKLYRWKHNL